MALRNIVTEGDEGLRFECKPVKKITDRVKLTLDDMAETMHAADGVGLAAPQIGILKRMAVVDVGEGVYEFINPEIIDASGEESDREGCLSVPGVWGMVPRPTKITVKALNRDGEEFTLEAEGFFARAICHELDHLDGILFIDKMTEQVELEEDNE